MRFLFAFIKDGNNLVKIGMDDGKERWMTTSTAVYGFAKKALKGTDKQTGYGGDEVKVEYTQDGGKYNCTRIEKTGGAPTTQQNTTTNNTEFKCSECGKALKDGQYKKCYLCNQKNPTKSDTQSNSEYKCLDCGKVLADNKYKKCYLCNQKNPIKKIPKSDGNFRTPEQLRRDEVGHMVSRSLVALQGTLDPNTIQEVIRSLYKLYTELVG